MRCHGRVADRRAGGAEVVDRNGGGGSAKGRRGWRPDRGMSTAWRARVGAGAKVESLSEQKWTALFRGHRRRGFRARPDGPGAAGELKALRITRFCAERCLATCAFSSGRDRRTPRRVQFPPAHSVGLRAPASTEGGRKLESTPTSHPIRAFHLCSINPSTLLPERLLSDQFVFARYRKLAEGVSKVTRSRCKARPRRRG